MNKDLSVYFKGVNFITPIIVGYFKINDYAVEVSITKEGITKIGKLTGITIRKITEHNESKETNLSFCADGHLTIEEAKIMVEAKTIN